MSEPVHGRGCPAVPEQVPDVLGMPCMQWGTRHHGRTDGATMQFMWLGSYCCRIIIVVIVIVIAIVIVIVIVNKIIIVVVNQSKRRRNSKSFRRDPRAALIATYWGSRPWTTGGYQLILRAHGTLATRGSRNQTRWQVDLKRRQFSRVLCPVDFSFRTGASPPGFQFEIETDCAVPQGR